MHIHVFEAGKSKGDRAIDYQVEVQHASLRIGGAEPCEVVVAGLPNQAVAEIRVAGGRAALANLNGTVQVAGREVERGSDAQLGPELLLSVNGKELVFRSSPSTGGISVPSGGPAGEASAKSLGPGVSAEPVPGAISVEHPSAAAKDMLKQVYAALGVPEEHPALVVFDQEGKVVKRVDLAPPHEEATIGRKPNNRIVLYHQTVSKNHAIVLRDGLGFMVRDLGSRNGTLVNGAKVGGQTRLKSGDRVGVGCFTLRFVDPRVALQDLAESVPDLKRLEKAKPGEQVRVGAPGDLEETTDIAFTDAGAEGGEGQTEPSGGGLSPDDGGSSIMVYALIGFGVLALVGIVLAIVLAG